MPLMIGRAANEGILIICPNGDEIIVDIDRIQKNYVKLAIFADRKYLIHRIKTTNEDRVYQQPEKRHDNSLLRPNRLRQDSNDCNGTEADCPKLRQGIGDSANDADSIRRDSE